MSAFADSRSLPERLLDDDPGPPGALRLAELFDDLPEKAGRDGEVVRRALGRAEILAEGLEGRRRLVVTVDVAEQAAELGEGRLVDAAVLFEAVASPCLEAVEVPAGLGHADDGHGKVAVLDHRLQRREDLLVGEVAGRAEEHQCVGMGSAHRLLLETPPAVRPCRRLTYRRAFRGVRRTGSASPRAACPRSRPRPARRSARTAPW